MKCNRRWRRQHTEGTLERSLRMLINEVLNYR
nr:MAG TPA: hypothetical protein [Caudoviricetes sp.]